MPTLTTSYQLMASTYLGNNGYGGVYLRLYGKYNSQDYAANTTNVSYKSTLYIENGYAYCGATTTKSIDGNGIPARSNNAEGTYQTGETILYEESGNTIHDYDGTNPVTPIATFYSSPWGWNGTATATWDCPVIPRYATITSFSVSKKDETSVTYSWSANATIDYVWYSKDNGSNWTGYNTADGSSGSFNVSGLNANTTYNFKLRVRRKDSQLTTDSGTVKQTTYDYPYCTNSPNFIIGNSLTLTFYNPLKRNITVSIIGANGSIQGTDKTTGTTITGYNNSGWQDWFYSTIPSATSGKYQVRVVYGSSTKTRNNGNTYTINANNCKPIFSDFEYSTDLLELTGNNDTIINGKTNTEVTISSVNKAIGNKSATVLRYSIQCGTQTPKLVNYSDNDVSTILNECNSDILKVTAIDSRGLETTINKTISNFKNYFVPTFVSFNVDRQNGIDVMAYLDLKLQFWNYNFGLEDNKIKSIKYRVKEQGSDTWSLWFDTNPSSWVINEEQLTITNLLVYTDGISQGFTVGKTYNLQLQVTDGSQDDDLTTILSSTFNLADGKVAFSILADNNGEYHIGINGMPDLNITLKVHGTIQYNS